MCETNSTVHFKCQLVCFPTASHYARSSPLWRAIFTGQVTNSNRKYIGRASPPFRLASFAFFETGPVFKRAVLPNRRGSIHPTTSSDPCLSLSHPCFCIFKGATCHILWLCSARVSQARSAVRSAQFSPGGDLTNSSACRHAQTGRGAGPRRS